MYVRSKNIKGHTYYYLVEGHRVGGRVKQKVIRYLGKNGWDTLQPVRFTSIFTDPHSLTDEELVPRFRGKIAQACKALNCTVKYDLRSKLKRGELRSQEYSTKPYNRNRGIRVRKDAPLSTLCHEFGHLVDYELRDHDISFKVEARKLPTFKEEAVAIGKNAYPAAYDILVEATDKKQIKSAKKFINGYVETEDETFANLFSLCLITPAVAERLAPETTVLIKNLIFNEPKIRDILTKLEIWELGTTDTD